MKKHLSIMALIGLIALVASPSSAQKINTPPVKRSQEPNGSRLVLMEYPRVPAITLRIIFPGGKVNEPSDKEGVAELTATLLRRGTEKRNAVQISEEIEFLGGSLGASVSNDSFTVSLDVLSKDIDAGLDLLADVMRNSNFPESELERERLQSINELKGISENPRAVASLVTNSTIYAGHPYGKSPGIASLSQLKRDDVLAYYRTNINPASMIVIATGDFKAADLTAKLRARFGDWQGTSASREAPKWNIGAKRQILVDKPDSTQTQLRLIRPAISVGSPDYYAAEVANTILGGGFTSRLVEEIRINRSLTYGIGSSFSKSLLGGTFGVSTFTKIETTNALIKAVREVLKQAVAKGFTDTELRKVKGFLAGQFAISAQTPQALAGQLSQIELYGLPKDFLQNYIQKIQAVTIADVNRIAKTYFNPNSLSMILVAPASKVNAQLKEFGAFEVKSVDSVGK